MPDSSEDGITVEFTFGGVTLSPSDNGLLSVTQNGLTTFVDPSWFAQTIADGIFENPHPAVAAQMDGDAILDLAEAPDVFVLGDPKQAVSLGRFEITRHEHGLFIEIAPEQPVESNFDLYVDGYTLRSLGSPGEMYVTGPDGVGVTLKTSQLTAFLDRRLTPSNLGEEPSRP